MTNPRQKKIFQTGYYGKIPGRGDFVSNHLPREFVEPWDSWLQSSLADSRNCLMEKWLETYLTSPIWYYYLSSGVCGRGAWAGVLMPSVDKVGRYFPLTTVCPIPLTANPVSLTSDHSQWFVDAEKLMLSVLADDLLDLEEFDQEVGQLSLKLENIIDYGQDKTGTEGKFSLGPNWHLPLSGIGDALVSAAELSRRMLEARFSTYSLWWSDGSELVEPSLLVSAGLPPANNFASMLDGNWQRGAWEQWPTFTRKPSSPGRNVKGGLGLQIPEISVEELLEDIEYFDSDRSLAHKCLSFGLSHVGKIRKKNEDAFLDLPEVGLWVVADGMGGHAAGEVASILTVYYLSNIGVASNLFDLVNNVKARLQTVNAKLLEISQDEEKTTIGCTVAVLMVVEQRAAYLWAGDSRVYLYRDGELQQLTKDHSDEDPTITYAENAENAGPNRSVSNVITRAVGADHELELDVGYVELQDDDYFLLCSDGLNKEVSDKEISELIRDNEALTVTQKLIDLTLDRGARDNVTVINVQVLATDNVIETSGVDEMSLNLS